VIVADGMSEDGTRRKLAEWRARDSRMQVLDNVRRIAPAGLNAALKVARGSIIVRMDAHSIYPANYVQNCVNTLRRTKADNVGGVVKTMPRNEADGALIVQAVSSHWFGVGGSKYRLEPMEGPADTVPFGCFPRGLFDRIGYFDERLVRHQDYEFNARIRKCGGQVWLDPKIQLQYFNQESVRGLLQQAYLAGRWNIFAWNLAPYAFNVRHVVPGIFLMFLVAGMIAAMMSGTTATLYFAIFALYLALAVIAAVGQARKLARPRLAVKLPFAFFAYHVTYGMGLWSGLVAVVTGRVPYKVNALPWEGAPRTSDAK